jgi:KipI family sensor histidine kinase inhibitor
MTPALQVVDCGDSAVRVACVDPDREKAWRAVHSLAGALGGRSDAHITSAIATYDAVLIEFDCGATDHATVKQLVAAVDLDPDAAQDLRPVRTFTIPVVYGGTHGPDLELVAEQQGLTPDEVIAIHTDHPLVMRCYGSPGGAPMLDGPDFPQPVPRRSSPRPHVEAGAVAVAGRQAVISARPAPGGWAVIGHTPLTLVDVEREPLSVFRPGDAFSFVAVDEQDWDALVGRGLDD